MVRLKMFLYCWCRCVLHWWIHVTIWHGLTRVNLCIWERLPTQRYRLNPRSVWVFVCCPLPLKQQQQQQQQQTTTPPPQKKERKKQHHQRNNNYNRVLHELSFHKVKMTTGVRFPWSRDFSARMYPPPDTLFTGF